MAEEARRQEEEDKSRQLVGDLRREVEALQRQKRDVERRLQLALSQRRAAGPSTNASGTDDEYTVCMERARTHCLLPCGHRCICEACADVIDMCPICREDTTGHLRVFL